MPFTYLAHQAPVLAIERRWPGAFDGVALALGSMAPDWAYALSGSRFALDGHSVLGLLFFCTPVAVVTSVVLRHISPVLFAYAPNPGRLPVRRLQALHDRRPTSVATVAGAALGALTHVVWDLFTHDDRWGPRHIGWLRSTAFHVVGHQVTWAKVLQYASHVGGSVAAVLLLAQLLRSGRFRNDSAAHEGWVRFWLLTVLGTLAGAAWALAGESWPAARIIRVSLGLAAGLCAGSVACRRFMVDEPVPASQAN